MKCLRAVIACALFLLRELMLTLPFKLIGDDRAAPAEARQAVQVCGDSYFAHACCVS